MATQTKEQLQERAKKIEQIYLEYTAKLDALTKDYKAKMKQVVRGAEQKKMDKMREKIKNI